MVSLTLLFSQRALNAYAVSSVYSGAIFDYRLNAKCISECASIRMSTRSSAVAVIADRTPHDTEKNIKLLSVTSLRTAGRPTHDPIRRVEFMNAPKLYPLKHD